MRLLILCLCLLPTLLAAQTDTVAVDTTIYSFADEAPRFPSRCETLDTIARVKSECSQAALLTYVNQRVGYPHEARVNKVSGTVVISFVVEKNGVLSRAKILKDPGAGLGLSALRAVAEMAGRVRFRPAIKDGKPVRFNYVLPIRFRLEEPKPYVLTDTDTVYVEFSKPLTFTGAGGKLGQYFTENVTYPSSGYDSCRTGQLDIQLLVHADNTVDVQDIIDYNDLGTDFTFEAIRVATNSHGQWSPAEYAGRPVTAAYDVSFSFAPDNDACAATLDEYNRAVTLINEGQTLARDSTTLEAGFAKLDEAVALFPNDGRFRIIRGQLNMDNNRLADACTDLTIAKRIALIDWFDGVLPLLCRGSK